MLQTCNGITALIPVLQIQLTPAQLQAIQMQLQGKQGNQPIIIQSSEQPAVQTIQTVTQADQSQFGQVRNAEPNCVVLSDILGIQTNIHAINLPILADL